MFEQDMDWPYLARVHHHLILDALMFALCHERSHLLLGHLNTTAEHTMTQSRKDEIDADESTLNACAASGSVDLRAAFRIFRLMHNADPLPAGAPLTHPHSTDRLLLLGTAMQTASRVKDAALRNEVNELLGALQTRVGSAMTDTTGAAAHIYLASDLDGAVVEAQVHEHFAQPPSMDAHDRNPKLWADAQAALIDPASTSVLTSAEVLILLTEFGLTRINQNETGVTLTKYLTPQVRTPPSWRMQWPHGRLELRELRNFATADDDPAHFCEHSAEFTADKMLKRHVLWNLPVDAILGRVTEEEAHLPPDASVPLEFAKWCDDYEHPDDALRLRFTAVQLDAAAVPPTTASELLETLTDIGRADRNAEESIWAFQTAAAVAATYWEKTGIPVKFWHGALSMQALFEQRWLDAFEHAFAETHVYQSDTDDYIRELFVGVCQAIRAHAPPTDGASAIVDHLQKYNSRPSWRHPRRRTLRGCLALLDAIDSGQHNLCVQQYKAETLTDLARLGDQYAAQAAHQIFDSIIAEFPWFTPAYAQACHLMLDQKRIDEARHYIQQAEDRDSMHEQVRQARLRLLDFVLDKR